jgi:transposase
MSYIVKQKIKGNVYAYEVESYWDPQKKQSRQRRRYLGVWDESAGKILPKKAQRDVKTTKIFGSPYLLDAICKDIDLRRMLSDAFGKDGDVILAISMSKLLRQTALKNVHHILDDSFIPEMYHLSKSFSSQWLSKFLNKLSSKELEMTIFYKYLINNDTETFVYDITSLSSTSRNIEWLEYGYNRDGLDLPQINLGLVHSIHRQIPLYYKIFPGSINDVVTLKNLIAEIKAFGISKCMFILDRGFYSENNIIEMTKLGINFIIPLPFSVKTGKGLISETNKDIENPVNARRYGGEIYHVLEHEIEIGGVTLYAYVLYNKKQESIRSNSFFNRLIDIENTMEGKKVYGNAREFFNRLAGNFSRYFFFRVEDKVISLGRRKNAISQALNRFGKVILLSSSKRSWEEVISLNKERDAVEKEFDNLKNDLNVMPLRVRNVSTLKGLLFIFFITLVIRSLMLQKARDAGLLNKNSIEDIMLELGKLRAVKIGGVWRLTEISKKERTILEKMKISIPIEPKPSY